MEFPPISPIKINLVGTDIATNKKNGNIVDDKLI